MKNGKNNTAVMILVVALVAAAAFYGGMTYQKSKTPAFGQFSGAGAGGGNGQRQFGRAGGLNGSAPVRGEITAQDSTSITVKLQDGSSKIVTISDKTAINKATTGTMSDLKTGEQVTAFGTKNSDGSVTAQIVTLGAGMFRGGPGGPSGAPKQ